jgi:hypothetical protein
MPRLYRLGTDRKVLDSGEVSQTSQVLETSDVSLQGRDVISGGTESGAPVWLRRRGVAGLRGARSEVPGPRRAPDPGDQAVS